MLNLPFYQIDAFAEKPFSGNPAAVVILDNWLDKQLMQNIAEENNLSETAFIVAKDKNFEIRFFTPTVEVDLCGHATLASGFVLFNILNYKQNTITFVTQNSGNLLVSKEDEKIVLDFPCDNITKVNVPTIIREAFNIQPEQAFLGKTDLMLIFETEAQINKIEPNFDLLKNINVRGIIISAPGQNVDFVSRFFAPVSGINEDPVTGSAHTTLIPYWSEQLNKKEMEALQLSKRGGKIYCKLKGKRVIIAGHANHYLSGKISI